MDINEQQQTSSQIIVSDYCDTCSWNLNYLNVNPVCAEYFWKIFVDIKFPIKSYNIIIRRISTKK